MQIKDVSLYICYRKIKYHSVAWRKCVVAYQMRLLRIQVDAYEHSMGRIHFKLPWWLLHGKIAIRFCGALVNFVRWLVAWLNIFSEGKFSKAIWVDIRAAKGTLICVAFTREHWVRKDVRTCAYVAKVFSVTAAQYRHLECTWWTDTNWGKQENYFNIYCLF